MENYERKYKKALGWMQSLYSGLQGATKEDAEHYFPELKETEDERIRKWLIDWARAVNWSEQFTITKEQVISWLEKQKLTDEEIIFRPIVGTDIRIAAKQALEKIDIGKKVVLAFNGAYIPVNGKTVGEIDSEYDAWLEKQKDYIEKDSKLPNSAYTSNKDVIEFADKYSHDVWEKLMDNFKKIENYHIGCNDVSDIVLNAIINTYNWLEKQDEKKNTHKREIDDAYLQGVCDAKHEIEKQGKEIDTDKVIAWLVANIFDFEYYVKLFKKDFGL